MQRSEPVDRHVQATCGVQGNLIPGVSVIAHFAPPHRQGVVMAVNDNTEKLRVKYFDQAQDRH